MKGFSLKIRCVAFQSTVHHQTHRFPIGQELSSDEQTDTLLVSSSNLVSKHWNILCFFEYSCWNLFEFQFLKYCTHKMRAFSKALKSRKRGVGALCWIDKLCPSHSDAHSGLCKTRRMTWIFFLFCFLVLILSFFFSTLAVGWHFKQLEAHRKYSFTQNKIVFVSLLSPIPPNPPFAGDHLCTFVSCNCVNVPVC